MTGSEQHIHRLRTHRYPVTAELLELKRYQTAQDTQASHCKIQRTEKVYNLVYRVNHRSKMTHLTSNHLNVPIPYLVIQTACESALP